MNSNKKTMYQNTHILDATNRTFRTAERLKITYLNVKQ